MSHAAPFSLLSVHLPDRTDPAEERFTWPLAGSLVIHAVVLIAFMSLRFASSLEQSSGSYEVTLVTFQEISASPTASPEKQSRPERNVDKVPPPKAEVRKAPKAAPPQKAVSPPIPVPQEKPRVPERVTDSLMGALDSVVVPKLQAPALPQKAEPAPAQAPPPIRQSPALEMDVQPIQAPPQPPKLDSDVVPKKQAPRVDPLAQTLKQAVGTIVVPNKPEQAPSRVSPTVRSDSERKQDTARTPESPRITLPRQAPRSAAVAPPEAPKKETLPQTARKRSTVDSLTRAIQSVRIPGKISKSKKPQPVSAAPLIPEASPTSPKAAEARNRPGKKIVLPPSAPELTKMPVEQPPVASQPAVSKAMPESDTFRRRLDEIPIPEVAFDAQSASKQTESGTKETLGLRGAGFCSSKNPYWENVEAKIDKIHRSLYRYHYRVESPAILTFRVMRNGQVKDLDLVRSSGDNKFDSVAKRAVLAALPLPPFSREHDQTLLSSPTPF